MILGAQALVQDWPLPALVKWLLLIIVVTGLLLLAYDTLVRYRWLGRLLNGPRSRRPPPTPTGGAVPGTAPRT